MCFHNKSAVTAALHGCAILINLINLINMNSYRRAPYQRKDFAYFDSKQDNCLDVDNDVMGLIEDCANGVDIN